MYVGARLVCAPTCHVTLQACAVRPLAICIQGPQLHSRNGSGGKCDIYRWSLSSEEFASVYWNSYFSLLHNSSLIHTQHFSHIFSVSHMRDFLTAAHFSQIDKRKAKLLFFTLNSALVWLHTLNTIESYWIYSVLNRKVFICNLLRCASLVVHISLSHSLTHSVTVIGL